MNDDGNIFKKPGYNAPAIPKSRKLEIPEGLFTKCPACGAIVSDLALAEALEVCPECDHHLPLGARARIESLCDAETFEEWDAHLTARDALKFPHYADRLKANRKKLGISDAVVTGRGTVGGHAAALAVMDFSFLGGSMGVVVGEKITRAIEQGIAGKLPVVVVSASGGARMHEGAFSLMQMAKISGALHQLADARLPFVSVLTNPTMGGVTASYATLGDLIIAEPRAMIGFAGPRVIKETTHQDLPPGFQTAEFLLEHGLIDRIVHRHQLKSTLATFLGYLTGK